MKSSFRTSRCFVLSGIVLALFLFTARGASAQFPGAGPGLGAGMDPLAMMRDMQSGPLFLLLRPELQKELKLDKSQTEQLKKIQKEQEALAKEQQKMSRSSDLAQMTEAFQKMQASQAEFNSRAKALLSPEQKQRFGEIRVQAMGLQAVSDPEIQTALGLTPEQKTAVTALVNEYSLAKMNAYRDIRSYKKKTESLEKEYTEKVSKTLTAEQIALWKKQEGAPFKDVQKLKMM